MADRETMRATVRTGAADVSGTVATASFLSEPIPMPKGEWSLSAFTTSLVVVGQNPTYTLLVSNSANGASPEELKRAIDLDITETKFIYKGGFPGEFLVVKYDANGATGGNKYFELFVNR